MRAESPVALPELRARGYWLAGNPIKRQEPNHDGTYPRSDQPLWLRHPHLIPVVSKADVRERNALLLVSLHLYSKPRRSGAIRQFVITGASFQLASAFENGGGSDTFRVV